jgi:hypothetical protein
MILGGLVCAVPSRGEQGCCVVGWICCFTVALRRAGFGGFENQFRLSEARAALVSDRILWLQNGKKGL